MTLAVDLANEWRSRLEKELPERSPADHESIVRWLLGEDLSWLNDLNPMQRQIVEQAMEYRYRILHQRYLNVSPGSGYKGLIQRLSNIFLIRNKIRAWIALSRDRQRNVVDVLEEVIQELLQSDRYMQQQATWIAQCTRESRLRNALLLASVEEYCLRPIRNQPLLCYRFVNYLRRSQKSEMSQIPADDFLRLVSKEDTSDSTEGSLSLLDAQVITQYQDAQADEERQELRNAVQQQFEAYLLEKNIDLQAVEWLRLYLLGHSQEAIAKELEMSIKQVYRLREKISYHASRVFASKIQPDLVATWLGRMKEEDLLNTKETLQSDNILITEEQRLSNAAEQEIEVYLAGKTNSVAIELLEKCFGAQVEEPIVQPDSSSWLGTKHLHSKISPIVSSEVSTELPLIDLFTRLQEAGLPLGINEYFLVLRAFQKGFGVADQEALADLCRALWVKSKDEEHLFNYHFEQVMRIVPSTSNFSPTEAKQETSSSSPAPNVRQEVQNDELGAEELPAPMPSPASSQELMEVEDEIQVAGAVQIATRSEGEVIINRFTQSDEYFPVTRRQMKQSWRHLRRMVREGPLVEIDIEATIACFSQQGIPSNPVLVPGRINRTKLLLLLDHKGSMVPFHALSQRLAETAQRGGRLGEAGVFYFHNCPTQYLYRDPSRQQAELVSKLLLKLRPDRSVVLIFSDGGAARGGFNPERLELTNQFLDRLKERVRYVTWLNPMAKERWTGTTAGEIAQRVPMFEMSRRGMERAIDVLRGRSLQIVG